MTGIGIGIAILAAPVLVFIVIYMPTGGCND